MRSQAMWAVLSVFVISLISTPMIFYSLWKQNDLVVYVLKVYGLGTFAVALSAFAAWNFAVESERHPENKSIFRALYHFFKNKPSLCALWQVVDGKLLETRKAVGKSAGPAQIVIPKDHAIVFEDKTGRFTHAEFGPDEVRAHPLDDLTKCTLVIIRPRYKRASIQNVSTQDGVLLERIDFSIFYHLKTDFSQYRTGNVQFPISQDTLIQVVYGITYGEDEQHNSIRSWEAAVHEAAKNSLQAEISGISLLQLYTSDTTSAPRRDIAERTRKRLNDVLDHWGVVAEAFELVNIAIPRNLQMKLEERWMAERLQDIKRAEGIAEGKRIEQIEMAKGRAWEEMLIRLRQTFRSGSDSDLIAAYHIQFMQYLDTLVKMSASSTEKTNLQLPQQPELLLKLLEERLMVSTTRQSESNTSETVIQRTPDATFVGSPIFETTIAGEEEASMNTLNEGGKEA